MAKTKKANNNSSNVFMSILQKYPFIKWVLLVLFVVLISLWSYYEKKPKDINPQDPEIAQMRQELKTITSSQKEFVKYYLNLSLDRPTKIKIFYELMGPLGGLDPIAKPDEIKDIHATVNYLYGFYFHAFEFPQEEAGYSATAPIRYESNYDEKEFFNENSKQLNELATTIENDEELQILTLGYTSMYRVNNYFGDPERNYYWRLATGNSPYYLYEIINQEEAEFQKNMELKNKYNYLLGQMGILEIQTIYKCDGKVIFIIDALSDNGFGYVYNAKTGNDVNCGLLKNRFRVIKDAPMDKKWRFWLAH